MPSQSTRVKKHARDPDLWERLVNSMFNGEQPILSPQESLTAARKLYRHAMGKAFSGEVRLTTGNRYTWVKRGVLLVNPDKREARVRGLRALIHDLSHYCHRRLHPGDSDHSVRQARLEGRMVKFALDRGWLDGTLKRDAQEPKAKLKPDLIQQRYARMVKRRDKWENEADRAKRLHEKAVREVRAYERRHGDRVNAP